MVGGEWAVQALEEIQAQPLLNWWCLPARLGPILAHQITLGTWGIGGLLPHSHSPGSELQKNTGICGASPTPHSLKTSTSQVPAHSWIHTGENRNSCRDKSHPGNSTDCVEHTTATSPTRAPAPSTTEKVFQQFLKVPNSFWAFGAPSGCCRKLQCHFNFNCLKIFPKRFKNIKTLAWRGRNM